MGCIGEEGRGVGLVFGQQLFYGGLYRLGGGACGLPAVAEGGAGLLHSCLPGDDAQIGMFPGFQGPSEKVRLCDVLQPGVLAQDFAVAEVEVYLAAAVGSGAGFGDNLGLVGGDAGAEEEVVEGAADVVLGRAKAVALQELAQVFAGEPVAPFAGCSVPAVVIAPSPNAGAGILAWGLRDGR